MPEKKIIRDMVPVKIRRIEPRPADPARTASAAPASARAPFRHFEKPKRKKNPRRRKLWLIILVTAACLAIIFAAITYVYAKATVIVTPKSETVNVNGTFTADKDGTSLTYEVIQTSETATTSVAATQGPLVENKAWGIVILYNAYSTTAQKLLTGTRLSNDTGLIYTTASTVTVPGVHKAPTAANPNATSTGSVAVYVVAEDPGADYNIAPTDLTGDFKIVAFQGSPKYAGFYGRVKPGRGIAGGYSGYENVVATSTLENATASLTRTVSSELSNDLKTLVPDGYVLYKGAYGINFASTTENGTSSSAALSLKGSLYGIMFKKTDLAKTVASAQVGQFTPGQFIINNIESLAFAPTNPAAFQQTLAQESGGPIAFSLNGQFGLVGTFPVADIAQGLAGLSVLQSKTVFAKYSNIVSAHAIITPFWKRAFPDSPSKITIDIQS